MDTNTDRWKVWQFIVHTHLAWCKNRWWKGWQELALTVLITLWNREAHKDWIFSTSFYELAYVVERGLLVVKLSMTGQQRTMAAWSLSVAQIVHSPRQSDLWCSWPHWKECLSLLPLLWTRCLWNCFQLCLHNAHQWNVFSLLLALHNSL